MQGLSRRPSNRASRLVLLGLVLAMTALVVPTPTVREAPATLVRGHVATGVDHSRDVVWILFLGSDARPGQRITASRADAIQMTGVNLRTGDATMIGIPRDAYVDIPGRGRERINAALYFGGPKLMGRTVGNLVGVQPDYVFTAGFDGFRQMVNSVGGVTVRSRFAFSDPVRPRGYRVGPNKLNGFQAMIFARIRKSLPARRLRPVRQPAGRHARDPGAGAGRHGRARLHGARDPVRRTPHGHRPQAVGALPAGAGRHRGSS